MPWKMSSFARAATSTTFPMLVPSLVTTASPVLTAVHAICSSAMRLMIEPVQLSGLDGGGLPEDQQEDRLACEALRLVVHGDRPAPAGHDQRCGRSQGELRCAGAFGRHRLGGAVIEGVAAFIEFGDERRALQQRRASPRHSERER